MLVGVSAVAVVSGLVLLLLTRAAGGAVSFEAERWMTSTGAVSFQSDSAASGGEYLGLNFDKALAQKPDPGAKMAATGQSRSKPAAKKTAFGLIGTANAISLPCGPGFPPADTASATANISFPNAGTYRVWVRMKADDLTHGNNIVHVTIDNVCSPMRVTANGWAWVNNAWDPESGNDAGPFEVSLSAAAHNITVSSNSAHLGVDKVMFAEDKTCQPNQGGTGWLCDPTPPPTDRTPPTVSIVVPTQGANVSGSKILSAAASDNIGGAAGISRVDYYLTKSDRTINKYLATATSTGYGWVYSWDTTTVPNGTYALQAIAYDKSSPSNFTRSGPLFVTVSGNVMTTTYIPSDDVYVNEAQPTVNFNRYNFMRISNLTAHRRIAYLKFNLVGISGPIQSAKLRLSCGNFPPDPVQAFLAPSNGAVWSETTLTWNNRLAAGTVLSYPTKLPGGVGLTEIGLNSALVPSSGDFSILLSTTGTNTQAIQCSAKEGDPAQAPQLVVTSSR